MDKFSEVFVRPRALVFSPNFYLLFLLVFLPFFIGVSDSTKPKEGMKKSHKNDDSTITKLSSINFCAGEELSLDRLDPTTQELIKNEKSPLKPCDSLNEHFLILDCEETECLPGSYSASPPPTSTVAPFGTPKNFSISPATTTIAPEKGHEQFPKPQIKCKCRVIECIECVGVRQFDRFYPCKKYSGYYYVTALTYSIFLGLLAVDRFYLGYSAIAVGKLMTLGGFGLWWLLDILLLVGGYLGPSDGSEWQPWNSDSHEDYWPKQEL